MFITVLFTIAKIWKRPKCPSVDKTAMVHLHDGILLYSIIGYTFTWAIKKKKNFPIVTTWVNLENIMLNEISHTERQILILLICGILKKS